MDRTCIDKPSRHEASSKGGITARTVSPLDSNSQTSALPICPVAPVTTTIAVYHYQCS